ncbi:uncharacterized protein [Arachis hypogaea]|uniref:uncharacterized protein n=1 Tax=Arachis hypogaea TaxID=3818 RepID=UPI003B21330E
MSFNKNVGNKSGMVEFVGPNGEVFMCRSDVEIGLSHQDALIELGCCCKNDLALVHYACALKWFINHGSTICEICGHIGNNIRISDFNKVVGSLKEYEALRERTVSRDPGPHVHANNNTGVDPDAVAAIRRQRLSEIALWFCPHNTSSINNNSNADTVSQVASEQPSNFVTEDAGPAQSPATKWAVEGAGILLATGLLTITLVWLIAPRVGKKTAKSGLHILLGGVCALTVVVFFSFVLIRIKYGPARYWAILFVFWFLVFAIWASRTLVLRHMVPIHNASPWYCARSQGFQVEERLVSVDELLDADEVFCTVLLILATGILWRRYWSSVPATLWCPYKTTDGYYRGCDELDC